MQIPLKAVDRTMVWLFIISLLLTFLFTSCNSTPKEYFSVLVFSKTAGFRHASIEEGKQMFLKMGAEHGFQVDTSEDATIFNRNDLEKYNVIVFLSTTGDILAPDQEVAMQQFMQAGGGWMGVHAAADTEYDWPWYNELVGAYFDGHPNNPNVRDATIIVEDHEHGATAHLGENWKRSDEWYNYRNIQDFNQLMRLDETSYEGGTNGDNHPISWYREFSGGRMFYTGLGHTEESYTEADFVQHVWGGLDYVAGDRRKLDFSQATFTPEENRFPVEVLVEGLFEPMEMELLPDGRPLWIQRRGEIMVYDFDFEATAEVAKMDVWTEHEDGILGLALDPDFEQNNWLYLYYSPNGEASVNRLSRFKWTGNTIDFDTEQAILDVPTDRNECCHSGGSIEFGPTGLLYLSVGDNTNPFDSDGYAPIDDSKPISNFDARRSASNTNDLRGKILRIKVEEDGSYTTPADNLFPDGEGGRPEIYVMGCRNPFRISVDQKTGVLYWGDVGPDAGKDSITFGPKGHCEVNYAATAGYYGWPLFIADNKPYNERNFETGEGGKAFDPLKPINTSKYNTGAEELPPARPAMIYYPYGPSEEFPLLGDGGRNPMAGPVYYTEAYGDSESKFPDYYDGKFFFYEWMRDWIMAAELDENGEVVTFEPFLPSLELRNPMDMFFGPDGDMYIIEYGKLWFKPNQDARILRIRFNGGNRPPVAEMEIAHQIGAAPFEVNANIGTSLDYDGDVLEASWLLDGTEIGKGDTLIYSITEEGVKTLTLSLDDGEGNITTEDVELIVGNSMPQVALEIEGNRSFFFNDAGVSYQVVVEDQEDGKLGAGIDPGAVTVSLDYVEGEDLIEVEYGHQMATEETQFVLGQQLIENSDCAGCHNIETQNIGPAYQAIAERYRSEVNSVSYLTDKILNGGGGVWGEQAMSAHPQLTNTQAEQMVNYILALAGPAPDGSGSLPLVGQERLNQHRPGTPGRYYFQASYTDKGAGDGLPRLTSRETVILREPIIPAHLITDGDKVMPYHVEAKDNPLSGEDMDVLVGSDKGWANYGEIDLTGIGSIEAVLLLAPGITSGGTIEILTENPKTGTVIGSASVKQGLTSYGENQIDIPLENATGMQDVYFRFKADDDEGQGIMGILRSFEFKLAK